MAIRQTQCSATASQKHFVVPCQNQNHKQDNNVVTFFNTTTPQPVPISSGQGGGGGDCDCTSEYSPAFASGSVWNSAFLGPGEQWQGNAADMLQVQTFAQGGTVNFGNCRNIGYKNVAGGRQWNGIYG